VNSFRPLVVIGAGGFGREALDVITALNSAVASPLFDILGVVDDSPSVPNLDRLPDAASHTSGASMSGWPDRRTPVT
jgi:hypothetical protein